MTESPEKFSTTDVIYEELERLIADEGSLKAVAEKLGWTPSYASAIRTKSTPMTPSIARKLGYNPMPAKLWVKA